MLFRSEATCCSALAAVASRRRCFCRCCTPAWKQCPGCRRLRGCMSWGGLPDRWGAWGHCWPPMDCAAFEGPELCGGGLDHAGTGGPGYRAPWRGRKGGCSPSSGLHSALHLPTGSDPSLLSHNSAQYGRQRCRAGAGACELGCVECVQLVAGGCQIPAQGPGAATGVDGLSAQQPSP